MLKIFSFDKVRTMQLGRSAPILGNKTCLTGLNNLLHCSIINDRGTASGLAIGAEKNKWRGLSISVCFNRLVILLALNRFELKNYDPCLSLGTVGDKTDLWWFKPPYLPWIDLVLLIFFFLGNRWFTLEKQHGSNPSGSCHYGSAAGPDQIKLAQMRV